MHTCCAPCVLSPAEVLRAGGQEFSLYFFNPNIQPYQEFRRRLAALRELAVNQWELLADESYTLEDFLRGALTESGKRCHYCYRLRMLKTAETARSQGFSSFSSTLLGSPYQDHTAVVSAAQAAAEEINIPFAYYDFRTGFYAGAQKSREIGLYRQAYCGCVFSERDRYQRK